MAFCAVPCSSLLGSKNLNILKFPGREGSYCLLDKSPGNFMTPHTLQPTCNLRLTLCTVLTGAAAWSEPKIKNVRFVCSPAIQPFLLDLKNKHTPTTNQQAKKPSWVWIYIGRLFPTISSFSLTHSRHTSNCDVFGGDDYSAAQYRPRIVTPSRRTCPPYLECCHRPRNCQVLLTVQSFRVYFLLHLPISCKGSVSDRILRGRDPGQALCSPPPGTSSQ